MKPTLLVLSVAALFPVVPLGAASAPAALSVIGDFTFASEHLFRGVESAGSSFQPSVEVNLGPASVGLWTNQPITDRETNEIDLYAGYRWTIRSVALEAVATYYFYPEARKGLGETDYTTEIGFGVSYDSARLSPSLRVYHDFDLKAETVEASLGYKLPFAALGSATIDTNIYLGAVDTRDVAPNSPARSQRDAYSYYGLDVSVPRKLNENATVIAGIHYVNTRNLAGTTGPGGFRGKDNLWVTMGLTVGF